MVTIIKFIALYLVLLSYSGCTSKIASTSLVQQNSSLENNNAIIEQQKNIQSVVTEYIRRISKKVIIVSDKPEAEYKFKLDWKTKNLIPEIKTAVVSNEKNKKKEQGKEQGKEIQIIIHPEILHSLKNEAELAFMLAVNITKLQFVNKDPITQTIKAMDYMAKAGYIPQAAVNLQLRALNNGPVYNWWSNLDKPKVEIVVKLDAMLRAVELFPQGLCFAQDEYEQAVLNKLLTIHHVL